MSQRGTSSSPVEAVAVRRFRLLAVVALLCIAMPLRAGQDQAGDPVPRFRADVDIVAHHVAVLDGEGHPVQGLTESDFRVYEDERRREIELFLSSAEAPLDVALVVDFSSSMAPVSRTARRAALTFLNSLDVDDCVLVLPFTERVGPGRWIRALSPGLPRVVDSIEVSGGTALYDAVLEGLARVESTSVDDLVARGRQLEGGSVAEDGDGGAAGSSTAGDGGGRRAENPNGPPDAFDPETGASRRGGCGAVDRASGDAPQERTRRRAMVLVSDGADENSRRGFDQVLAAARAANTPVFPVALGLASQDPQLERLLADLARLTGGELIEEVQQRRLRHAFGDVLALLRGSYVVGYYPEPLEPGADPGGAPPAAVWHDVEVRLRRPNYRVLHRPGYYR